MDCALRKLAHFSTSLEVAKRLECVRFSAAFDYQKITTRKKSRYNLSETILERGL